MTKLRLSCFGHIKRRAESLEKTIMLGKVEGSRKRGRRKEPMDFRLQELSRAVEDRIFWRSFIHRVNVRWRRLDGMSRKTWGTEDDGGSNPILPTFLWFCMQISEVWTSNLVLKDLQMFSW